MALDGNLRKMVARLRLAMLGFLGTTVICCRM